MKAFLTKLFSPILNLFESDLEVANYKPSHRIVLNVVGALFWVLSAASLWISNYADDQGFVVPVAVFFLLGLVTLVVGTLGSNAAVAKIWGSRK